MSGVAFMDPNELYRDTHSAVVDTGLVGVINSLLHRSLERNIGLSRYQDCRILELGAGKGQHLRFVNDSFAIYVQSDIRPENLSMVRDSRVENRTIDAQDLSLISAREFDRVIATCLLVHLSSPEQALREWKRVTAPGGVLSIYIPCEPGFLLRSVRYLTTNLKAKKLGYRHLSVHYREHVTFFVRLNLLIHEVFADSSVRRRFFPFAFFPSWNFNLWCTYQIQIPCSEE